MMNAVESAVIASPHKTIVRPLRLNDIEEGVELGHAMWEESLYAKLPFNRNKVADLVKNAINSSNYFCRVACFGDDLNGFMLGYVTSYFFNDLVLAQDLALFVRPDKRGSSAALKLIYAFEEWARERDAVEVCLSQTTGVKVRETQRLYSKLGFEQVGTVHKKRMK